jgi:redox-sensing transcriptional repressor
MIKILRLGRYLEIVDKMPADKAFISSSELARLAGVTSSTVRQDFFNLLEWKGKSKRGYDIALLRENLMQTIGLDQHTRLIVIGAGRLGQAIVGYKEFHKFNIHICAFFDKKTELAGSTIDGIQVYHIDELGAFLTQNPDIRIAVITVPEQEAFKVVDYAEKRGIKAIWNFAPVIFTHASGLLFEYEYIGQSLYNLIYNLNQNLKTRRDKMEIMVCVGSSCHLKGAEDVIKKFQSLLQKEKLNRKVNLKGSFCQGKCSESGVTVKIGDDFHKTIPAQAEQFFYDELLPVLKA